MAPNANCRRGSIRARTRIWLQILALGLFFLALGGRAERSAESTPETPRVGYRDGELSVHFVQLPVAEALRRISSAAAIDFTVDHGVHGTVTDHFERVPLQRALSRLFGRYNLIMTYAAAANGTPRVSRVMVLRSSQDADDLGRLPTAYTDAAPAHDHGTIAAHEVRLMRGADGHYTARGGINRTPVDFLIDTGASRVALSRLLATELNLSIGRTITVETAGGPVLAYETMLEQVNLGQLDLHGVAALILPSLGQQRRVLLGMSFLHAFDIAQVGDTMTIRKRYPTE